MKGPGESGEYPAREAVVAGWQTLTWEIAGADLKTWSGVVFLPNLGTLASVSPGETYFVDDVSYLAGAGGGGGGGGGGSTTFTGGIFASDYLGNLGNNTAKTSGGGNVGFFFDPRLASTKVFEDGGVSGSTGPNPLGVLNFYYGVGKASSPQYTDAFFGAYVNAPGNTTADASAFSKIKLKFWGDAETWEKTNFTAMPDVILQGPTNAACTNPSGRPELKRTVTGQKIGAGSEYVINKTDFTLAASCGGTFTANSIWAGVATVVVQLIGTNLQYVNIVSSSPPSYPTFINVGPISFVN